MAIDWTKIYKKYRGLWMKRRLSRPGKLLKKHGTTHEKRVMKNQFSFVSPQKLGLTSEGLFVDEILLL